jgi:hypothetical protein
VAVDGYPAHAGTVRDVGYRAVRRPELLVELDGCFDDPVPGLALNLGAALESVGAGSHQVDDTRYVPMYCRSRRCEHRKMGPFARYTSRVIVPAASRYALFREMWWRQGLMSLTRGLPTLKGLIDHVNRTWGSSRTKAGSSMPGVPTDRTDGRPPCRRTMKVCSSGQHCRAED